MKILIACEYSGRVRDELIRKGHNAISVDIIETESPGPHMIADVLTVLNDGWDMMIAFPPCTFLTKAANRALQNNDNRKKERIKAFLFFMKLYYAPISKVCVENPVGIVSKWFRKPDQIIQPYYFGEPYQKTTCLWLKNLPKLEKTEIIDEKLIDKKWFYNLSNNKDRGKIRSLTFQNIAIAMADQWG